MAMAKKEENLLPFRRDFYPGGKCPYMLEEPCMKGVEKHFACMQDDGFVYFRLDMPGFAKGDVDFSMDLKESNSNPYLVRGEEHTLTIKGEKENELGEKQSKDSQVVGKRSYCLEFDISPVMFKSDEIVWGVNKGVLKKLLPRVEPEYAGGVRDLMSLSWDKKDEDGRHPCLVHGSERRDERHLRLAHGSERGDERHPCLVYGSVRREWFAKEEEGKGFSIRIDMPGLGRDDVKVFLERDNKTLIIEGLGKKESKFEGYGRRHIKCKLDITKFCKTVRTISLENGLFLLTIPLE